jgi:hypothetical protein
MTWTWGPIGDRDIYWGFSVRPFQANNTVEILRMVSTSDNNLEQTTELTVRIRGFDRDRSTSGMIRFTALSVRA